MTLKSFERSVWKYFPAYGQRYGLEPIDAVMEGIIRVIESHKVQEWLDGSDEIRNIEGYLIKSVLIEQARASIRYINDDKTEGRLAPEFYDRHRNRGDRDLAITINQIKQRLSDEEAQIFYCIEQGFSFEETLERTGMTKHRYYKLRQEIKERLS